MVKTKKQVIADEYQKVKKQIDRLQLKLEQKKFEVETYCKTRNLDKLSCSDGSVIKVIERTRKTTNKDALIAKFKPSRQFLKSITKITNYTEVKLKPIKKI
jgi:hypothetical protein